MSETVSSSPSVRAPQVRATAPLTRSAPPRQRPSLASGLIRTARPHQWVKNVLVFAAPGAAGVLTQGSMLARACIAFGVFCMAASGTYFLNDVADRDDDRRHPTKRGRPIAAGVVPEHLALAV